MLVDNIKLVREFEISEFDLTSVIDLTIYNQAVVFIKEIKARLKVFDDRVKKKELSHKQLIIQELREDLERRDFLKIYVKDLTIELEYFKISFKDNLFKCMFGELGKLIDIKEQGFIYGCFFNRQHTDVFAKIKKNIHLQYLEAVKGCSLGGYKIKLIEMNEILYDQLLSIEYNYQYCINNYPEYETIIEMYLLDGIDKLKDTLNKSRKKAEQTEQEKDKKYATLKASKIINGKEVTISPQLIAPTISPTSKIEIESKTSTTVIRCCFFGSSTKEYEYVSINFTPSCRFAVVENREMLMVVYVASFQTYTNVEYKEYLSRLRYDLKYATMLGDDILNRVFNG